MSAGAGPVVIESGGQCETVVPGRTGFHWRALGELAEHTRRLAGDEELRTRMAVEAVTAAQHFSRQPFVARVAKAAGSPNEARASITRGCR
jgi:hypothetical protein